MVKPLPPSREHFSAPETPREVPQTPHDEFVSTPNDTEPDSSLASRLVGKALGFARGVLDYLPEISLGMGNPDDLQTTINMSVTSSKPYDRIQVTHQDPGVPPKKINVQEIPKTGESPQLSKTLGSNNQSDKTRSTTPETKRASSPRPSTKRVDLPQKHEFQTQPQRRSAPPTTPPQLLEQLSPASHDPSKIPPPGAFIEWHKGSESDSSRDLSPTDGSTDGLTDSQDSTELELLSLTDSLDFGLASDDLLGPVEQAKPAVAERIQDLGVTDEHQSELNEITAQMRHSPDLVERNLKIRGLNLAVLMRRLPEEMRAFAVDYFKELYASSQDQLSDLHFAEEAAKIALLLIENNLSSADLITAAKDLLLRSALQFGEVRQIGGTKSKAAKRVFSFKSARLFRLFSLISAEGEFSRRLGQIVAGRELARHLDPSVKGDLTGNTQLNAIEKILELVSKAPFKPGTQLDTLLKKFAKEKSYTLKFQNYFKRADLLVSIPTMDARQLSAIYAYLALSSVKVSDQIIDALKKAEESKNDRNLSQARLAYELNKGSAKPVQLGATVSDSEIQNKIQSILDAAKGRFSEMTQFLDPKQMLSTRRTVSTPELLKPNKEPEESLEEFEARQFAFGLNGRWQEVNRKQAIDIGKELGNRWHAETSDLPSEWQDLALIATEAQSGRMDPRFLEENFADAGVSFLSNWVVPYCIAKLRSNARDDTASQTFYQSVASVDRVLSLIPANANDIQKAELLLRLVSTMHSLGGPLQENQVSMLAKMQRVADKPVTIIASAGAGKSTMASTYTELFDVDVPYILHISPFKEDRLEWSELRSLSDLSEAKDSQGPTHFRITASEFAKLVSRANDVELKKRLAQALIICDEFDGVDYRIGTDTVQNVLVKSGVRRIVNMSATDSESRMLNRLNRLNIKIGELKSWDQEVPSKAAKAQELQAQKKSIQESMKTELRREIRLQPNGSLDKLLALSIEKAIELKDTDKRSVLIQAPGETNADRLASRVEEQLREKGPFTILYRNNRGKLMIKTVEGEEPYYKGYQAQQGPVICLYTKDSRGGDFGTFSKEMAGAQFIYYPKDRFPPLNELYQNMRRLRGDDRNLPLTILLESGLPLDEFLQLAQKQQTEIDRNNEVARLTEKIYRKAKLAAKNELTSAWNATHSKLASLKTQFEEVSQSVLSEPAEWLSAGEEVLNAKKRQVFEQFSKKLLEQHPVEGIQEEIDLNAKLQNQLAEQIWKSKKVKDKNDLPASLKNAYLELLNPENPIRKLVKTLDLGQLKIQGSQLESGSPPLSFTRAIISHLTSSSSKLKARLARRREAEQLLESLGQSLEVSYIEPIKKTMLEHDRKTLQDLKSGV